jgi:hypothetical protein
MPKNKKNSNFFVGYADALPRMDRRVMVLTGGLGLLGAGFAGAKLAVHQQNWGDGQWDQAKTIVLEGHVEQSPYPVLRTASLDGQLRSVSLVCSSKCGVSAQLLAFEGKTVWVRGSMIARGRHRLLAVVRDDAWIGEADTALPTAPVREEYLGRAALNGEILDAKCWTGAMRPGSGKTHKACASLCIRMGGTPWFWVKDKTGKQAVFELAGPKAEALRDEILPLVGEPVRVNGKLFKRDDLVQFRVDPDTIHPV